MAATRTMPLTEAGTILGTFQYMAPEQLEGGEADARTDIFSFGALLFEMVTGRKAFEGKSQASLISAIMSAEPPAVSSLQSMTPPALDRLIFIALQKDPDARWQSAQDLANELRWIAEGGSQAGVPAPVTSRRRRREWIAWAIAGAAVVAVAATVIGLWRPAAPPAAVVRFTMPPPDGAVFGPFGYAISPFPAVSPDGRRIAFAAHKIGEHSGLWVRGLDSLTARLLPGTSGTNIETTTSSWSPNGQSLVFSNDGKVKRIDLQTLAVQIICSVDGLGNTAWLGPDAILFGGQDGIYRVAAAGGTPARVTTVDKANGQIKHDHPVPLPDGRHFLFWATDPSAIYVGSLDSPAVTRLLTADVRAEYVDGNLLFVRGTTLFAQRFDPARLTLSGEPTAIAQGLRANGSNGRAAFSVSAAGILSTARARSRRACRWPGSIGTAASSRRWAARWSMTIASGSRRTTASCFRCIATTRGRRARTCGPWTSLAGRACG
jgi:hypothetical protein